jgi:hypothetical protein
MPEPLFRYLITLTVSDESTKKHNILMGKTAWMTAERLWTDVVLSFCFATFGRSDLPDTDLSCVTALLGQIGLKYNPPCSPGTESRAPTLSNCSSSPEELNHLRVDLVVTAHQLKEARRWWAVTDFPRASNEDRQRQPFPNARIRRASLTHLLRSDSDLRAVYGIGPTVDRRGDCRISACPAHRGRFPDTAPVVI